MCMFFNDIKYVIKVGERREKFEFYGDVVSGYFINCVWLFF